MTMKDDNASIAGGTVPRRKRAKASAHQATGNWNPDWEPFAKLDWPTRPQFGLIEGRNEAHDEAGEVYYSFINRVLIARKP